MKCCNLTSCKSLGLILSATAFLLLGYWLFSGKPAANATVASKPTYLYVQTAQSGKIELTDPKHNGYIITVDHVNPHMTYFSDQPNRITGSVSVDAFVRHWQAATGDAAIQPNVVVHGVDAKTKRPTNTIFALSSPLMDVQNSTIRYQAHLIGAQKLDKKSLTLDHTVIFIDNLHWHGNRFDPPGTNGN